MSIFNPQAYLDATFSQPTEKALPLQAGDQYTGVLGMPKTRVGEKDGKGWVALDIPVLIQVPPEQQPGLPPTITRTWTTFYDLTETGLIDQSQGKNRGVRMLRVAINKNKPGDVFSPSRDVEGQVVRVSIKHELYKDEVQDRLDGLLKA
jgi:hypothetical protein